MVRDASVLIDIEAHSVRRLRALFEGALVRAARPQHPRLRVLRVQLFKS
jgi:hypothetical protein